jgi:hypothetical protein
VAGNKHDVEKAKAVIDAITSVYHHEITHPGVVRRPFDAQRSAAYNRAACNARRTHSRNHAAGCEPPQHERARARRCASFATVNLPLYLVICCVALLPRRVCAAEGATIRWSVVLTGNTLGVMCASLGLGIAAAVPTRCALWQTQRSVLSYGCVGSAVVDRVRAHQWNRTERRSRTRPLACGVQRAACNVHHA